MFLSSNIIADQDFNCDLYDFNLNDDNFMEQFVCQDYIRKLFVQVGENKASSNELFRFKTSGLLMDVFKEFIFNNDPDFNYHREEEIDEVDKYETNLIIDKNLDKEYKDILVKYDCKVKEYLDSHPEFYETIYVLPNLSSIFSKECNNIKVVGTIEQVVDAYKISRNIENSILAEDIKNQRNVERRQLKRDKNISDAIARHKDELKKYYNIEKIEKETDIVLEDHYGKSKDGAINLPTNKVKKYRICLNRSKPSDSYSVIPAITEFVYALLNE